MPNTPVLPAEITIYTIGTLHQEWLKWLAKVPAPRRSAAGQDKPWLLDASAVDEVDAAGVQLLLSLSHSLAKKRRTLRLIHPSHSISSACSALGVGTLLMTDDAAGSAS